MIKVVVLGASGSVGTQALEVIKLYPQTLKLVGISVNQNTLAAKKIASSFKIKHLALTNENNKLVNFYTGKHAIDNLLTNAKPDIVLNSISGIAGLEASLKVIEHKINLALANKETLVMAGSLVKKLALKNKVNIYPVDSEHNAIAQLLKGTIIKNVNRIILTASGGPFFGYSLSALNKVTLKQAINHPTWKMGKKISIDSATMFNKGLEVIEAHHLFNLDYKKISVMINRTSLIHSMVELNDGSIKAHIGIPSMKIPLINALTQNNLEFSPKLDQSKRLDLSLMPIKKKDYPALDLAYKVGELAKHYPMLYCVANEVAVSAFINKEIKFKDIYQMVDLVVKNFKTKTIFNLTNLKKLELEMVSFSRNLILSYKGGKA
jgi:1-deoxy-D-xylulose-5-phosphate reductoisomerase